MNVPPHDIQPRAGTDDLVSTAERMAGRIDLIEALREMVESRVAIDVWLEEADRWAWSDDQITLDDRLPGLIAEQMELGRRARLAYERLVGVDR